MVRALRHSDGKLGVFNGGLEGDALTLDRLLGLTDPTTLPPISAPYTGFQKISTGATSILMDCGKPGGPGISHHAGTLSFEVCVKQYRMIVNCGAHVGPSDPWRTALAATAAHSTLTINDTSSAAFDLDGRLRRGPGDVTCVREDGEHGTLIEARHDGYDGTFGLIHQRSLFLSPTGSDICGEDRIIGTGGEYATVRFHLHPDVHVSLLGGGNSALLRIGTKIKQTWRFKASVGDIKLEESIYLGRIGHHRRTEQIIITAPLSGNGTLIKWSLTQEGK
ncbi:MAG: heparinase II/III-family protein [Magnetovibrio sp.]|nr:heparinase II/III-family protein [Magnetovibrio sp.]